VGLVHPVNPELALHLMGEIDKLVGVHGAGKGLSKWAG
jgi:hypothetical protein